MDISKIFKSQTRKELFRLYFTNPDQEYYLRELERILQTPVSCSHRPRLRPRGASAPEGGPLARREQRGIISNGVKGDGSIYPVVALNSAPGFIKLLPKEEWLLNQCRPLDQSKSDPVEEVLHLLWKDKTPNSGANNT